MADHADRSLKGDGRHAAPVARPARRQAPGLGDPRTPLLSLQRAIGNRATNDLLSRRAPAQIRRFATDQDFDFADQDRAGLPLSLSLIDIQTGQERHHIISDRHLLRFLADAGEVRDVDGEQRLVVPVNAWVKAAIGKEIERSEELLAKIKVEDLGESDRRKHGQQQGQLQGYVKMLAEFGEDEETPYLAKDQVTNDLLPILEWMPPNLIIDKQARRYDPGDELDVEALVLHSNLATRKQLATIAIAIGDIEVSTLNELTARFKGTKDEQAWGELLAAGLAAKGNTAKISTLLADLQNMPEGMKNRRGGKEMAKSRTTQKEKLVKTPKKGQTTWEELILKLFPGTQPAPLGAQKTVGALETVGAQQT